MHSLEFNFGSADLLLLLLEGETWVVGTEDLRGLGFFLRSV